MAIRTTTSILYQVGGPLTEENPVTGLIIDGVTQANENRRIPMNAYNANDLLTDLSIGCGVTEIRAGAFLFCENLGGPLNFPHTLTTLGDNCFSGCSSITSINLASNLQTIGDEAFGFCTSATGSIEIPNTTISVGSNAFEGCANLNGTLYLGASLQTIGYGAFRYCGFTGSINIPNSVTSVGPYAFANLSSLDGQITIGNGITTIPEGLFYECSNVTGGITIPNQVTSIGSSAFKGLISLSGPLILGSSVTTINQYAFQDCNFFGSLVIPNLVTNIGQAAFQNTGFTGTLTIGNSVTTIGAEAFEETGFVGPIVIPNSVTTIGAEAFRQCSPITSVFEYLFTTLRIGSGVTSIGDRAFMAMPQISKVEMFRLAAPAEATDVFDGIGTTEMSVLPTATGYGNVWNGLNVVYDLGVLSPKATTVEAGRKKAYHFPSGVTPDSWRNGNLDISEARFTGITTISNQAFFSSTIETVIFDNSLVNILYRAFAQSQVSGGVVFPSSLRVIGIESFFQTPIGTIQFNDGLLSIRSAAFQSCDISGNIVIPNSVNLIGSYAFADMTGAAGILDIASCVITEINEYCFSGGSFVGDLILPSTATMILDGAFYQTTFSGGLTNLTMGPNVTHIGAMAFMSCDISGALNFPPTLNYIGNEAFKDSSFNAINFFGATPPAFVGSDVFENMSPTSIHCPVGSLAAYSAKFPTFTIIDDL